MRFGNCTDCGNYRFLEDGTTCPSCLEDDEEWVVLVVRGFSASTSIYKTGLTKEKAKEVASKDPHYIARPRSEAGDY